MVEYMITIKNKKNLDSILNLLYYLFNRLLFSNKLPIVKVKSVLFADSSLAGCYIHDLHKLDPIVICIDPRTEDPVRVLVHEMCHVYYTTVLRREGEHPPGFVRLLNQKYKKLGFPSAYPEEIEIEEDE